MGWNLYITYVLHLNLNNVEGGSFLLREIIIFCAKQTRNSTKRYMRAIFKWGWSFTNELFKISSQCENKCDLYFYNKHFMGRWTDMHISTQIVLLQRSPNGPMGASRFLLHATQKTKCSVPSHSHFLQEMSIFFRILNWYLFGD